MSLTDENKAGRSQAGSDTLTAADSPVVDHGPVNTPPVPRVSAPPPRTQTRPETADGGGRRGVKLARISQRGDKTFKGMSAAAGFLIVALVAFVGVFLIAIAAPSLARNTANFFTSREWQVSGDTLAFGIAGLLWTTVLSSVVAMVIAVPIAIGVALCITNYIPKRLSRPLAFVVDLLAAVPSIIFGLWGITVLAPLLLPAQNWLSTNLGWFPLFAPGLSSGGTVFVASIVLAIMILPIITAISRDVFEQTPHDHVEAAWALGATRWEMIRTAVLPYGRSGVVSASMLGLGRALGETIAVMIILSTPADGEPFNPSVFAGGETFASKIANAASEFDTPSKTGAYIAAGLVLFVITFVVNAIARTIADRGVKS
ncbi:phosphate ABC transporter permease subunit PstC [Microlunatus ginsengisoli]|uniref:Phosphate transport system permease protein n=1 Tax=Microlunatus ginsengisoli TaxID=363863 RepID=A0ABP6ZK64_9ACTN